MSSETTAIQPATISRRHDLDALRAIAMLLGIVLHGAMSFMPSGWLVQDSQSGPWAGLLLASIHGFRMPLFFLISGFFTAMLWRKRGLKSLLLHRFKRIFLPLLIGMFTIVPAVWIVSGYVTSPARQTRELESTDPKATLGPELLKAAVAGDAELASSLLERGADVNTTDDRSSTPLHVACLFGHAEVAGLLLDAGADTTIVNQDGSRAEDVLATPWPITQLIAGMVQIEVKQDSVIRGRKAIAERMGLDNASGNDQAIGDGAGLELKAGSGEGFSGLIWLLMYFPVFHHLWFLWFLCWLVIGFAICVTAGPKLGIPRLPRSLVVSVWRYAWLIPLTAIPQFWMEGFGPATSIGLLPMPSVLIYYAIFFGYGALYFDANDDEGVIGHRWWFVIPIGVLVLFPIGIILQATPKGIGHIVEVFCAVSYAWLLSFGLMGLFRRLLAHESRAMRYISDSSYWLYLIHIPLIIYIQYLVRDWPLTAWIKLPFICLVTSLLLLISYQLFVRYTPIGTLLNGRRYRPRKHDYAAPPLTAETAE